jgi:hypothetical protein
MAAYIRNNVQDEEGDCMVAGPVLEALDYIESNIRQPS